MMRYVVMLLMVCVVFVVGCATQPNYEFLSGTVEHFTSVPHEDGSYCSVYLIDRPYSQVVAEATTELQGVAHPLESFEQGNTSTEFLVSGHDPVAIIEIFPRPMNHVPSSAAQGAQVQIDVRRK